MNSSSSAKHCWIMRRVEDESLTPSPFAGCDFFILYIWAHYMQPWVGICLQRAKFWGCWKTCRVAKRTFLSLSYFKVKFNEFYWISSLAPAHELWSSLQEVDNILTAVKTAWNSSSCDDSWWCNSSRCLRTSNGCCCCSGRVGKEIGGRTQACGY